MAEGFARATTDGTLLRLRVAPGAKTSSVEGAYGESALKIKVAAPPADGRANDEARRFPTRVPGVPRSALKLTCGATGRDKTVHVMGLDPDEVRDALSTRTG